MREEAAGSHHDPGRHDSESSQLERTKVRLLLIAIGAASGGATLVAAYLSEGVWQQVAFAVSTSIFSSVLFYALYSKTAEDALLNETAKQLEETARQVAEAASDAAEARYRTQYRPFIPAHIFPESHGPLPAYNDLFLRTMMRSNSFLFKGDSGSFASFRLTELASTGYQLGKQITLLVGDPQEPEIFQSRARLKVADGNHRSQEGGLEAYERQLKESAEELRQQVFQTLVALFDIRCFGQYELGFHRELPFFRLEQFDDGIFVYYYSRQEWGNTFYYDRSTQLYKAMSFNFLEHYRRARSELLVFDDSMTAERLTERLGALGCDTSIPDLRAMKETKFEEYRSYGVRVV